MRAWKHKYDWETSDSRTFLGYAEAAKQRLERHGFARPFQFQEDAKLQDAWTTWVEYIEYQCWRLDTDLASIGRLQADYDAACKRLQKTGVLKDGETEESVYVGDASRDRLMEITEAAEALDRAVQFYGAGRDSGDGESAKPAHIQKAEALLAEALLGRRCSRRLAGAAMSSTSFVIRQGCTGGRRREYGICGR